MTIYSHLHSCKRLNLERFRREVTSWKRLSLKAALTWYTHIATSVFVFYLFLLLSSFALREVSTTIMVPSSKSDEPNRLGLSVMSAWKIRDYKGISELKLEENLPLPRITHASDLLIEIYAASINWLDVMMAEGHGKMYFETFLQSRLPVTLGRDFAGVVRAVGSSQQLFKPGDEVIGVVPPQCCTGSHARYVVVPAHFVVQKPTNLSMVEAASLPNAGLTAWTALRSAGPSIAGKSILVMGAAGGVGSIALQLSKIWGCSKVIAVCSSEAVSTVKDLGFDHVIDYQSPDADSKLRTFGGFDIVVDCTGKKENYDFSLLKPWANAKYITLSPTVLDHFDNYGYDVVRGVIKTLWDLVVTKATLALRLRTLRWVFVSHCSTALSQLCDYVQSNQLKPVIDSVFPYDRLPEAYSKMKAGHNRGKIVVEMKGVGAS